MQRHARHYAGSSVRWLIPIDSWTMRPAHNFRNGYAEHFFKGLAYVVGQMGTAPIVGGRESSPVIDQRLGALDGSTARPARRKHSRRQTGTCVTALAHVVVEPGALLVIQWWHHDDVSNMRVVRRPGSIRPATSSNVGMILHDNNRRPHPAATRVRLSQRER